MKAALLFFACVMVPGILFAGVHGIDRGETCQDVRIPVDSVMSDSGQMPASRPLIDTSATNVVHTVDQAFFRNTPSRGINAAIMIQPGVVVQGTDAAGMPAFHIRGGRSDEIGYTIEGVNVGDMLYGGRAVSVTPDAVEQIQVHGGGSGVGEGGGRAGVIGIQLRTGREDRWGGSFAAETDRFTPMNTKALGGYSYGYSDWTGTIGGPFPGLGNTLRLFGSVQNTFYRDPTVSVRSGWDFSGANSIATDTGYAMSHPSILRRDTLNLAFPGGNALGGQDNRWIVTGTALIDIAPLQIRLAGSYGYDRSRTATVLENVFNQSRLPLNIERDGFFTARLSRALSPALQYEVSFNYFTNTYLTEDPELLGNLFAYGDPEANAALGYTLRTVGNQSYNWSPYTLWGRAFQINEPGTQIAGYEKRDQKSFGGRAGLSFRVGQNELNVGGEYTRYTIRRFAPAGVFARWNLRNQYADPAVLEVALQQQSGTDTYGYDVFGSEIDGDVIRNGELFYIGPGRPAFAAAYVQDRIELSDLTLNLGLRYDYINPDSKDAVDPGNSQFGPNDLILATSYTPTAITQQLSPRIGVSVPLSEKNTIHAQYGRFVQQSGLRESYMGSGQISQRIKGGYFVKDPFGWGLKPTNGTQYEVGFTRQLSEYASIDVTAFYKEIHDQTGIGVVFPDPGSPTSSYLPFMNLDFSKAKGIELTFALLRTNRVSVRGNYAIQDVKGTESNPSLYQSPWSDAMYFLPNVVFPLEFNVTHSGSMQIDYRFGKDDGGDILEQLGLNVLMTFSSGHSFTRLDEQQRGPAPTDPRFRIPVEPLGASTTPWFVQIDARIDKNIPLGPLGLDIYLYAINLLGTDNPVDVFTRSGDPSHDGWFATAPGQQDARTYGPQYLAFYNAVNDGRNSGNWGPPRQIRFGMRLEY